MILYGEVVIKNRYLEAKPLKFSPPKSLCGTVESPWVSLATLFGFWGTFIKFSESMILCGVTVVTQFKAHCSNRSFMLSRKTRREVRSDGSSSEYVADDSECNSRDTDQHQLEKKLRKQPPYARAPQHQQTVRTANDRASNEGP